MTIYENLTQGQTNLYNLIDICMNKIPEKTMNFINHEDDLIRYYNSLYGKDFKFYISIEEEGDSYFLFGACEDPTQNLLNPLYEVNIHDY